MSSLLRFPYSGFPTRSLLEKPRPSLDSCPQAACLHLPFRRAARHPDDRDCATFARRYLSGRDPLAASTSVWMQAENPYLPIIGVVGDVSEAR